ncbi:MAG TPA: hypothetical protein VEY95_05010 [Azospirillaceae bacterium]|nr:hypothetical protein [Azospirillaceae bacterium]
MLGPPTIREAAYGVHGVFRLLRFDRSGLAFFDASAAGAMRSFWLAPVLFPAFLLISMLQMWGILGEVGFAEFLLVEAVAYVIGWTLYPLAAWYVAERLDRAGRYTGYLTAYNWFVVPQAVLWLPLVAAVGGGLVPEAMGDWLLTLFGFLVLVYHWFIAREALELPGPVSFGLVVLDVLLAAFVQNWAIALL